VEKLQAGLAKEPMSLVDNRRETPPLGLAGPPGSFRVNLSKEALALLAEFAGKLDDLDNGEEVENKVGRMDADAYNRLHMLKFLIGAVTGKKIKFMDAGKRDGNDVEVENGGRGGHAEEAGEAGEAGRSIEYRYREYRFEQEVLIFEASGVINTAGGRQTSFTIKFTMTRTYYSARTFDFVAGEGGTWDGTGPFVNASSNSGTAFSARGSIDTDPGGGGHSMPGRHSVPGRLLAYDGNSYGVEDGSSGLFGSGDGNGFKELAIYDTDANNRIDENDPIYKRLYVRVEALDGEEHLIPLKEAGISAIYLDYADTRFALKDGANSLEREVVRAGAYVNDNGRVGTVQQVNVVA
jgi:hypothetical protein